MSLNHYMSNRLEFEVRQSVNNATVVVFTVPANSYARLQHYTFGAISSATGYAFLTCYNAAAVAYYTLATAYCVAGIPIYPMSGILNPSICLEAGYTIKLVSSVAGLNVYGAVSGYIVGA